MTSEEATEYWEPAKEEGYGGYIGSCKLAKLLGIPYGSPGDWNQIQLTKCLKRQLVALRGLKTNREFVVKVIRAQEEEYETSERTSLLADNQATAE